MDATVRYERFDDGGLSAALGVLSVRDRVAVGGHFTVYEGPGAVYFMGELRWTRTRVPTVVAAEYPTAHGELFLGFGVSF
jgi:hypothetical protein